MRQRCILLSFFITIAQLHAQDKPADLTPIVFIYDASGSMWGQIQGKTKMEVAADVLSNSINNLPEAQKIGFVAYGHRKKGDCQDVEFLIDIDNASKPKVIQSLEKIKPLGKTPLAFSALQVIDKLRATKQKATIVLLTDGIESCDGNICDVVEAAKEEGVEFKLHIIGFGLKAGETEQLKCAANAGDGNYYDAADAEGLSDVLDEVMTSTIDKPEGNFSVYADKNGKPVDAYVRALLAGTGTEIDIVRTYADTALLYLPAGKYDLYVKPLAGSDVNAITVSNVQSFEDSIAHQTVSFDGGKIKVTALNNGQGWDAAVNVNSETDGKRVSGGRTYGRSKAFELNPGMYQVEIKALAMKGAKISHLFENVEVKANEVNDIEHNFKTGIAMIGATSAAGLVDASINIVEVGAKRSIAGGRTYTRETSNPKKFVLTPGTYEVTLVALGAHKGKKETFTIVVKEGETISKITTF